MNDRGPAGSGPSIQTSRRLERLDADGAWALRAGLGLIRDLGALGERAEALRVDRALMHEQVGRAVVGSDEPEALLVAEPLHCASWHLDPSIGLCRDRGGMKPTTRALTRFSGIRPVQYGRKGSKL